MKLKKLLGFILAFAMMIPTSPVSVMADETDQFECTILYTNDVHTYIDQTLSYATISQMKQDIAASGENVLLVDAGDHVQGTAYGALDKGKTIIELMNETGYDVATFGNHEFDYGMERALDITEQANFPYVSCNFMDLTTNDTVVDPYYVKEVDGKKIAFVGVTTPETITSSTPAYFMNEDQTEYIYGIDGEEQLYEDVQKAVDAANEVADYVIVIGHCGVDDASKPNRSIDIIANTSGIDAWIDGHSHTTLEKEIVKDKAGNDVVLTQTGCYFAAIGKMTITGDEITTELVTSYDGSDDEIAATETAWKEKVQTELGTQIGESDQAFYVTDPDTNIRLVRSYETNGGDINADSIYYYFNEVEGLQCDVGIANGGGVRADVTDSTWTYLTCKTVNPFGNVICLVKVSGQTLLDALEYSVSYVGTGEFGGYLQVAGITFDVDTSIPSTVQVEDDMWVDGPTDVYRVCNVQVYDKATGTYQPLDLNKEYTVGGVNYILRNQGNGYSMFKKYGTLVKDYVAQDYLAYAEYIKNFKDSDGNGIPNVTTENSPLASYANYKIDYSTVHGSGRINYIDSSNIDDPTGEETTGGETTGEETTGGETTGEETTGGQTTGGETTGGQTTGGQTTGGQTTGTVVPNTGIYGVSAAFVGVAGLALVVALKKKKED